MTAKTILLITILLPFVASAQTPSEPQPQSKKEHKEKRVQRGIGIKVVEGQRIAEQIIFRPRTNAVKVLTRSAEDSLLTFDEKGGVKEVPITGDRVVLTDDVIRRLVRSALAIKRVFGNREQDIEWAYMKGQIYIVQARPFVPGT